MKKTVLLTLSLAVAVAASAGTKDGLSDLTSDFSPNPASDMNASLNADKVSRKTADDTTFFDRGINRKKGLPTFIPKGTVALGLTATYVNYDIGNGYDDDGYSMLFSLLQNTKGNYETVGVAVHGSYFVRKNMSVGARFSYDRDWLAIGSLALDLGEDLDFDIDNFSYYKNSYSASVFMRNFIPFGQSKRFALFYEVRATYSYGESKSYSAEYDDVLDMTIKDGTFAKINKFEFGVVPGIMAFLSDYVAAEVSIGMLGVKYQHNKQIRNQVEVSEMERTSARLKVNLFSLGFGVSYYIPTGNQRPKKNK
ncbi:MAG: hypothetical protein LUD72_14565 [Bacteroidales bacterium]|nr:hypothetical protein [Bacteroidales bacterium]